MAWSKDVCVIFYAGRNQRNTLIPPSPAISRRDLRVAIASAKPLTLIKNWNQFTPQNSRVERSMIYNGINWTEFVLFCAPKILSPRCSTRRWHRCVFVFTAWSEKTLQTHRNKFLFFKCLRDGRISLLLIEISWKPLNIQQIIMSFAFVAVLQWRNNAHNWSIRDTNIIDW